MKKRYYVLGFVFLATLGMIYSMNVSMVVASSGGYCSSYDYFEKCVDDIIAELFQGPYPACDLDFDLVTDCSDFPNTPICFEFIGPLFQEAKCVATCNTDPICHEGKIKQRERDPATGDCGDLEVIDECTAGFGCGTHDGTAYCKNCASDFNCNGGSDECVYGDTVVRDHFCNSGGVWDGKCSYYDERCHLPETCYLEAGVAYCTEI